MEKPTDSMLTPPPRGVLVSGLGDGLVAPLPVAPGLGEGGLEAGGEVPELRVAGLQRLVPPRL